MMCIEANAHRRNIKNSVYLVISEGQQSLKRNYYFRPEDSNFKVRKSNHTTALVGRGCCNDNLVIVVLYVIMIVNLSKGDSWQARYSCEGWVGLGFGYQLL